MMHPDSRPDLGLSLQEELARRDPKRVLVLHVAADFFRKREFAQFRQWLQGTCESWASSPSAVQLTGLSYFEEGNHVLARQLVERAAQLWSDLGEVGLLRANTLAIVLSYVACCRSKIECAQGRRAEAEALLWKRIEELQLAVRDPGANVSDFPAASRRIWRELLALSARSSPSALQRVCAALDRHMPRWKAEEPDLLDLLTCIEASHAGAAPRADHRGAPTDQACSAAAEFAEVANETVNLVGMQQ